VKIPEGVDDAAVRMLLEEQHRDRRASRSAGRQDLACGPDGGLVERGLVVLLLGSQRRAGQKE
jgi:hypothetical protein